MRGNTEVNIPGSQRELNSRTTLGRNWLKKGHLSYRERQRPRMHYCTGALTVKVAASGWGTTAGRAASIEWSESERYFFWAFSTEMARASV